ncbi:MAG TPA: SgcJ/EcaC family oxidoreductase [Longimicrobium sp.]|jgi:uncharacterized protein (TIGR02246 family)
MATDPHSIAREIVGRLEEAWNAGDSPAFARPFADDADFVDIRGDHHRGREVIAEGHRGIFASIYRGSRIRYEVTHARELADGVILAHSTGELEASSGPMAGRHRATQSLVLVRDGSEWRIAAFHNTLVTPQPGGGGA